MTAVIGTSTIPRLSAALAQRTMRSIEIGSAPAMPTALPRSRAIASSRASARSISVALGTASIATSDLAKRTLAAPAIWPAKLRCAEPSSR